MKSYDIPPHLRPGGVVSTRVLRSAGYSYRDIRQLHLSGDLVENLRPGWWSLRGADPAVVAAVRAGGVMTCVSSLVKYGVYRPFGDDDLHVRASRGEIRAAATIKNCSPGRGPAPVVAVDHPLIAVRAAIRCLDVENAVAVLDSMIRTRIATVEDLRQELSDLPRGRDLLGRCDRADSGTESLVRVRLRALNLKVRSQVQIDGVGRVDLVVGERLVIEVDSKAHHTDLANYRADRIRDRRLAELGYRELRVTWEEVMFGWEGVEQQILAMVHRGDHHWPRRRAPGDR
ncbi:MAG: endonuclease domain-containing protein [Acidipropionibacterium sp.]|nr:endonuclease domain-containing protein [Acidipropionibacterium sp.]